MKGMMFLNMRGKKIIISIVTGAVIFFTLIGMSISYAGNVNYNNRQYNDLGYNSGYSLKGLSVNKNVQKSLKSFNNYYHISSNSVKMNSYSISTARKKYTKSNILIESKNVNEDNSNNRAEYQKVTTAKRFSNKIITDKNYSTKRSNSISLSKAIKSASVNELPRQSSDELLESLPKHVMTYEKKKLLELINRDRQSAGLHLLKIDDELCQIAQLKSQDMYDFSYFSHTSPNFGKTSSLIRKKGIRYNAYGENIGRTHSVYRAHNGFMNSPLHKANIMNSRFTHIGIGIVGNYYTEVFISK